MSLTIMDISEGFSPKSNYMTVIKSLKQFNTILSGFDEWSILKHRPHLTHLSLKIKSAYP